MLPKYQTLTLHQLFARGDVMVFNVGPDRVFIDFIPSDIALKTRLHGSGPTVEEAIADLKVKGNSK